MKTVPVVILRRTRTVFFLFVQVASVFLLGSAPAAAAENIVEINPFDPAHRPWPDVLPSASSPSPMSPDDLQLYGVVIAGEVKRAVVKVGGSLKHLAGPGGRTFLTVREGQSLGAYTVGEIQSNQVVLTAGAARHLLLFGKKTDRPLAPSMAMQTPSTQPLPTPVSAAPAPTAPVPDSTLVGIPASSSAPAAASLSAAPTPPMAPQAQAAPVPDPAAGGARSAGPQPGMSLAEAIAAAQAAAAQGNLPPTPNPFQTRK